MGRLVQRVQRHPPLCACDGRLGVTLGRASLYKALQGGGLLLVQGLGLEGLPVIELGAIAQGESGHEIVLAELHRFCKQSQTLGTGLAGWVVMRAALRHEVTEPEDVHR
jgi:hypothetical protein